MGGPYWKNIFQRSQKRPETEGRGPLLRPRENIFLKYGPTETVNNLFIFFRTKSKNMPEQKIYYSEYHNIAKYGNSHMTKLISKSGVFVEKFKAKTKL